MFDDHSPASLLAAFKESFTLPRCTSAPPRPRISKVCWSTALRACARSRCFRSHSLPAVPTT